MLSSFIWILLAGFFAGQLTAKLNVPSLVGMIVCGLIIGPQGLNVLSPEFLAGGEALRIVAVMIILAKAGLGLDREKLEQQGSVALRLGFLPAGCEMVVVAIASWLLLDFDWPTGLLLGCILSAESPAVIVPGMLYLKQKGFGVNKGIPDAILTGSALSDVLVLLVFNLVLGVLTQTPSSVSVGIIPLNSVQLLPFQLLTQILGGIVMGMIAATVLNRILASQSWTQTTTQDTLITACVALLLIVFAAQVPFFSGYLAVMTLGFLLVARNAPLARRLRQGFNSLWAIAQIILFVLLGASIQLDVLGQSLGVGLGILAIGTILGRGLGWYLSTLGSNWTRREKLYLLAGNSAKATVQAAIGAIPLAAGLPGGDVILALSALSILVTAPLGAWAIPFFAPRLLSQDEVDPTKVLLNPNVHILAAVDCSPEAGLILSKAAELARYSDGTVTVLHVLHGESSESVRRLQAQAALKLADIPYEWLTTPGEIAQTIIETALRLKADPIVIGKTQPAGLKSMGSVSELILSQSPIPTVVITP